MLIASHRHTTADLALWAELEEADKAHGALPQLARKVERSIEEIRSFAASGRCYAGLSGGIDSMCLAHLVRLSGIGGIEIPFVHISAVPLTDPYALTVLAGIPCYVETADYSAMPDQWTEADEDRIFRASWKRAEIATGASRHLSGVRADESGVRKLRMRRWGLSTDRTCCPLGWWNKQDTFGFAAAHDLPVHPNYAMLGTFQNQMERNGLVIRQEQTLPNFTALATNTLLLQLAHQITTNVMVKTGTIQTTGLTANVDTLATLTDTMLEATSIQADNKPIRNNPFNLGLKAYHERQFNTIVPEGYFPLTFVDGQSALLAYRGDKLPGGSQFNLQSNIIAASANNRQRLIQEYILGGAFPN